MEAGGGGGDGPPSHSSHHPSLSLSQPAVSGSSTPSGPNPPKKRITRKRAIMSCRNCTARKIRCERDSGQNLPCRACTKRGEGALCDPGSTPGASNSATS